MTGNVADTRPKKSRSNISSEENVEKSVFHPVLANKMEMIGEYMQTASPAEQEELMLAMNEMQVKDTQRMFNGLTERCFEKCVTNFRQRELAPKEKKCVNTCATKFMAAMTRMAMRYAEEAGPGGIAGAQAGGTQ
mmetsp:Transcript_24099/g.33996  ORF Transcript_24099/g.33996 Transcript_24099/m.33996 type:complete len:135 (-) Transcript_24099:111-515(-)|eukprot:CAMPEP_0175091746 /NCGR_PEP_ID=MMETSP0086_2-20121207/2074_1 /TAXON_ID=136419 /ORGANISM="Unknown Unknown, Strain D1" /LENGTH=134 /DNA_ID=CAMNT_0016364523 /DNA_START=348 /DNA_END=752 /DNA_ORIENTATION=-